MTPSWTDLSRSIICADWSLLLVDPARRDRRRAAEWSLSGPGPRRASDRLPCLKTSSVDAKPAPAVMRTVLVVGQFSVSIGLGIAAIVVFSQIRFARNIDLGFNRDGIVILRGITALTPRGRELCSALCDPIRDHGRGAVERGAVRSFNVSNISPSKFRARSNPLRPDRQHRARSFRCSMACGFWPDGCCPARTEKMSFNHIRSFRRIPMRIPAAMSLINEEAARRFGLHA